MCVLAFGTTVFPTEEKNSKLVEVVKTCATTDCNPDEVRKLVTSVVNAKPAENDTTWRRIYYTNRELVAVFSWPARFLTQQIYNNMLMTCTYSLKGLYIEIQRSSHE